MQANLHLVHLFLHFHTIRKRESRKSRKKLPSFYITSTPVKRVLQENAEIAEALVLLLMDNHATHTTLEAVDFCRAHNIFLLGFPPHTSHKQQPLDDSQPKDSPAVIPDPSRDT
ncbi:hypothetical protein J437_LFUL006389 [Ladona fulva]|uniref:DDE-1 domain-containing protein n=1 Tax=Ladona fulva TaxID=123851 RepID=A0A8K0K0K8_LADFU|nr:hypothetical protein J437_LFUL006389 [Ladona fulva]